MLFFSENICTRSSSIYYTYSTSDVAARAPLFFPIPWGFPYIKLICLDMISIIKAPKCQRLCLKVSKIL